MTDRTHYAGCWRTHLECAVAKVDELEERLRWRKYPEEKPTEDDKYYYVITKNIIWGRRARLFLYEEGKWKEYQPYFCEWQKAHDDVVYWLPIPPLESEE